MTPMIGRSHGIHAEPITFGLKLALMFDEFGRAEERLEQTLERVRVGKLSGAVGTHAHLDPRDRACMSAKSSVCKPAKLSTQIIQRDRHAEFSTTLALIASSIDRWATEFRHLQRTEVLEVEEFFSAGQKGSSAMPHKRNPITGERLSGLARVVRGQRRRRARERRPLARTRHQPLERGAHHPAGFVHAARLHAGETARSDRAPPGLSREHGAKSSPNERSLLQPVGPARADPGRRRIAKPPTKRCNAPRCEPGKAISPSPKTRKRNRRSAPCSRPMQIDALCSLDVHFRHVDETFRALGLE